MKIQLMVSAIGEDRPGIVARLAEVVAKNGGNLEDSRMAILGGEFASISLVSVPHDKCEALEHALQELKNDELTVFCKKTKPFPHDRHAGYSFYEMSLTGADHEGIVHIISSYLRDLHVNFQSVETSVAHAPETGIPLFTMRASIAVPPATQEADLRKALSKLADEAAVEIDLVSTTQNASGAKHRVTAG